MSTISQFIVAFYSKCFQEKRPETARLLYYWWLQGSLWLTRQCWKKRMINAKEKNNNDSQTEELCTYESPQINLQINDLWSEATFHQCKEFCGNINDYLFITPCAFKTYFGSPSRRILIQWEIIVKWLLLQLALMSYLPRAKHIGPVVLVIDSLATRAVCTALRWGWTVCNVSIQVWLIEIRKKN